MVKTAQIPLAQTWILREVVNRAGLRNHHEHRTGAAMPNRSIEDLRLTRVTEAALALPEATRKLGGSHAQFQVRKRTFAYFLNDHHGDGIVAIACKVLDGDNKALAEAQPGRFYLPAYIGPRGWVALRLDTGKIDWDEVRELLSCSYALVAPKRLAEAVQSLP
jgi:phosphoribosylglycinamide formyltransferase-1